MQGAGGPDLLDTPAAGSAAVRGGVQRIVGYVVGVAVTVASAAVLFRHLGVDDAGRYVLVLSVVNLAAGLTDAGLSNIGVRELALRQGHERRSFLSNLLGLRVALTVLGLGGACVYAVAAGLGGRLVAATAIAGLGVLVQNLQSTYATALMADLRLARVTVLDLVRQIVTALAIVALAAAGAGLIGFFAVAPFAGLVVLAPTVRMVRRSVPLWPAFDVGAWRRLIVQALPFALAASVAAVYFRLAILLVDLLSTDRQTGLFGASFRIVEVLIIVPQLLIGAALPIFSRAARDDAERLRYGLGLVTESMLMLGAAVALGLVAAAPFAIDVVAGSRYADATPVLRIHAVALFFAFLTSPFVYALLSLHRHREVVLASLVALATLAAGLALLVPDHGAVGAAIATAVGEAVLAACCFAFVVRAGVALRLGRAPRVLLAAAPAAIPVVLLPAIPAALAAEVVFVGLLLALRAVPDELLDVIRRRSRTA